MEIARCLVGPVRSSSGRGKAGLWRTTTLRPCEAQRQRNGPSWWRESLVGWIEECIVAQAEAPHALYCVGSHEVKEIIARVGGLLRAGGFVEIAWLRSPCSGSFRWRENMLLVRTRTGNGMRRGGDKGSLEAVWNREFSKGGV